ncbi:MAG: polysaccharide deacetylase family protein [Endozoicomonadaceae bacterium]|nr:polysaccharide deacetylase family protein [Endozoicomonadaceae bacterium]
MLRPLAFFSFLLLLSPRLLAAEHAVILQYHHVSDDSPRSTSVTPAQFEKHLSYLKDNNFTVMALPDVIDRISGSQKLPDHTVAITFDDAYTSIYHSAFPLLRKYGYPFTIFVNTEALELSYGQALSWQQLNEMAKAGASIANHGVSHHHLVERNQGEDEQAWLNITRQNILKAEQIISAKTGQDLKLFAWPYGETAPALRKLIGRMNFIGFGQQSGAMGGDSDFTKLPRFPMGGVYSKMNSFITKVNTLPLPVSDKTPDNSLIDDNNTKPTLQLTLAKGDYQKKQLACYGLGKSLAIKWQDAEKTTFQIQSEKSIPLGRSRFNCTAPDQSGRRYYWYSHDWLRLTPEGKALD